MKTGSTVNPGNRLTLYDLLQVAPRATEPVIHAAYRALAHNYHPDHNHTDSAETLMRELNAAYTVLRDPRRRARYDAHLARSGRLPASHGRAPSPSTAQPVNASRSRSSAAVGSTRIAPRPRGVIAAVIILAMIALLTGLLWAAIDGADDAPSFGTFGLVLGPLASTNSQWLVNSATSSPVQNVDHTLGVA